MTEEIKLGKYKIIKELGRGGFGFVYEGHDLILGRDVALKVLHSQHGIDRGFFERFGLEARMAAQLEHPYLVPVYDFNEIDGRYIIVMGLMKGGSLKDQIKQYGAFDTFRAKKVLEQILEGIHFIHQNAVVHCDLKPSNILFDQHGTARISDLGFAKALRGSVDSSMSVSGGLVGTPAYMAPEVWHGKKATEQSDIYSLGCITYEMLTGEALFYGETPAESMTKHLIVGPQMDADLPKPWRELIEKCLNKEPSERYPSAGAMLEDLKFGLFDVVEERETEIVLRSSDGNDEDKQYISSQPRGEAFDYTMDEVTTTIRTEINNVDRADYNEVLQEGNNQHSTQTRKETLTLGQMMELSPYKRLQMRLPWLMPLSLGVIIILLTVTFISLIKKNKFVMAVTVTPSAPLIPKMTDTPTHTPNYTPTTTKTPTSTRKPSVTSMPTIALELGSTQLRETDGMVMVYVPEGFFTMGSNHENDEEKPEHEVYLDAFWIDKFEVSNAQYKLCVEANACTKPNPSNRYEHSYYTDHPVVNVDWYQASAYCEWAGGRLPSEAEWEKAARGTGGNVYPWGSESPNCRLANYGNCVSDTTVVGTFPDGASYYGVMDMAGNVVEWVNDWWVFSYDLSITHNPIGPDSGIYRVLRGGSWDNNDESIRTASRFRNYPGRRISDSSGFRCVFPQR
jgi:serine/threonine protein kinase